MTSIGTRLFTWRFGELVGEDSDGNRYYRDKKAADAKSAKRWVVFKGEVEASKVPAEWHAWLHRTTDDPPDGSERSYAWQKPHKPNLTGTPEAYHPPGSVYAGGQRSPATGDYEPWTPN